MDALGRLVDDPPQGLLLPQVRLGGDGSWRGLRRQRAVQVRRARDSAWTHGGSASGSTRGVRSSGSCCAVQRFPSAALRTSEVRAPKHGQHWSRKAIASTAQAATGTAQTRLDPLDSPRAMPINLDEVRGPPVCALTHRRRPSSSTAMRNEIASSRWPTSSPSSLRWTTSREPSYATASRKQRPLSRFDRHADAARATLASARACWPSTRQSSSSWSSANLSPVSKPSCLSTACGRCIRRV